MLLYEISIDNLEGEEFGLQCVSLVDEPAIMTYFQKFSNIKKLHFNEEKRIVKGVALIPDLKIYRYSQDIGEYYVFFSKETIEKLVLKYSKDNKLNLIDFQHDGNITSDKATCIESFIVSEDTPYKDFPVGSWVLSYKIMDDELWESIKDNEVRGFSVEVCADCIRRFATDKKEETFEEFLESFFFSVDLTEVIEAVVNHKFIMCKYDDDLPEPATGYRQFVPVAVGVSKAGNYVLRCYEYYGDHRDFSHDFCLMRLDRVQYWRVMEEMGRWEMTDLPADAMAIYNPFGDRSMLTVIATAY